MVNVRSVRAPKGAIATFQNVAELDAEHAQALVEALSSGQVRDRAALRSAVVSAVGGLWTQEAVSGFIRQVLTLSTLRAQHNLDAVELSHVLTEQFEENLDANSRAALPDRLVALLYARDIVAFSQAADVATEHDQVFHASRIVTDVRPVFSTNSDDDPVGAVVVHMLRIEYLHEGHLKTISFALDADDLSELSSTTERAIEKQHSLSRALQQAAWAEFDITGEKNAD